MPADPTIGQEAEHTYLCLIEDDVDMRKALAAALRTEGYHVLEAADGTDVIGRLDRIMTDIGALATIDVVVTDQRMPGATGLEVLRDVRNTDWATPVVLISAFADVPLYEEARRLGATAVLRKPFKLNELLDTVLRIAPPS